MRADPHFLIKDRTVLAGFLSRAHIDPSLHGGDFLLDKLCVALSQIPYENLTKIIKSDAVMSPRSAKRFPDELIGDYLRHGAGGTCFSLTATYVAVLRALGIEAHPILAHRRYGPDTHCAVILSGERHLFLLDPGYLIHKPMRLPTTIPTTIFTGFNTVELLPHEAGSTVDLITIVNNDRRFRLTYKITPVDGETFGHAWERSFAWEMMTYPVLTSCVNGVHHYLQGNMVRIRDHERTIRRELSSDQRCEYIARMLGIDEFIVNQAISIICHGRMPASISR